ncbi:MAG TPA: hypothetical protein VE709_06435 [Pseudonocardiaceae bacterium]|jgi:uncharacterized membrane protein|nr:hypothetical protein [Pseudonocardiaceae bacterium]
MTKMAVLAGLGLVALLAWSVGTRTGTWRDRGRWGLAVLLVVAGSAHLLNPLPFLQHLPPVVPGRALLVAATGVIEIGLGAALLGPATWRRAVGRVVAVYFVAIFPANVYVAVAGVDVDGLPDGHYPWLRLPLQIVLIVWALWCTTADERMQRGDNVLAEPE